MRLQATSLLTTRRVRHPLDPTRIEYVNQTHTNTHTPFLRILFQVTH